MTTERYSPYLCFAGYFQALKNIGDQSVGIFVPETAIELSDGVAEHMGDGVFAVLQTDERGVVHSVLLTPADCERMLAGC